MTGIEALLRPRTLGVALLAVLLIFFPYLHTWPLFGDYIAYLTIPLFLKELIIRLY